MITFEIFKEIAKEEIRNYLGDDYENAEVKIEETKKVNEVLTSMIVIKPDIKNALLPVIYLENYYPLLEECPLNQVLTFMANDYRNALKKAKEIMIPSLDSIKNNVVFQLINTENNKALLEDVPHREYMDLSIIYRWVIHSSEGGIESSVINNNMLESIEANEDELYQWARKNTPNILPPLVENMKSILDTFIEEGVVKGQFPGLSEEHFMWVISNEQKVNGAISMFYGEVLHKLADRLNNNLYILPSSIHEVIAVPASNIDPGLLKAMVVEINQYEVAEAERLSDNIYYYDREKDSIDIVKC